MSFMFSVISSLCLFPFDLFPSYIPVSSQYDEMMKWASGGNSEAGVFLGECTFLGVPFILI